MPNVLDSIPILDRIFILAAGAGTALVLIRLILVLAGSDLDGDDLGIPGEGDGGDGFQFLSVLGLSSFFMMFGLVGLALSRQSLAGAGPSIAGGILAGAVTLWVLSRLFRMAGRLQSSGTLDPQSALGCTGTVYLTIPPGGTGRVLVQIGRRLREMDAVHAAGTGLPSGTHVKVVGVERSLLSVEPLSPPEA